MYCPNCGEMLPEGTRFCGACGSEIAEPVNMDAAESAPAEEMTASGYEEGPNAAERTAVPEVAEEYSPTNATVLPEPAEEPPQANVTTVPEHAGEPVPTEEVRAQGGQPAAGKSGKNNVLPVLLIMGIVAVIIAANVISAMMPTAEERWQGQYDLGQQYLMELDYEQAIVAFTAAIEIDENKAEAYVARAEAYLGGNVESASEENLQLALADYDTAILLGETSADVYESRGDAHRTIGTEENLTAALDDYEVVLELGGASENTYIHAAGICVIMGDYDHAAEILAEGEEVHPDSKTISDMVEEVVLLIEEREQQELIAEQRQVIENEYWDVLMTLVAVLAENPEDVGTAYWYDDDYLDFADSLIETQYWEMENGLWIGVYPEGYIYYGEMADGERSGHGVWYLCNPVSEETLYDMENGNGKTVNFLFVGEWRDDYPNGWGTYYYFILELCDDAIAAMKAEFEMNYVNGSASGSGTFRTTGPYVSGECVIEAGEDGTLIDLYTSDGGYSYDSYIEETGTYFSWWEIRVRGALQ